MIRIFVLLGMRILVSCYTHSAVSNILQKLIEINELDFVYLNGNHDVCDKLKEKTLDSLMDKQKVESVSELQKLLERIKIFGVTCLSTHHPALSRISFDIVIIDEAGQITLPNTIMPLLKMKPETGKFVLIGDLHQLPPLVKNVMARQNGLDLSLFASLCKLNHPNSISELKIQYRMNCEILKLCNSITYDNSIVCANTNVSQATISFPYPLNSLIANKWLPWQHQCFSMDLNHSVVFLNYTPTFSQEIYSNHFEASIVLELTNTFLQLGIKSGDIGVITPYNQQKELLRNMCLNNIEINTIDQFQGYDKSIIIISFVRQADKLIPSHTIDNDFVDILQTCSRLNVAISRAKHKLIFIGVLEYLANNYEPVKAIKYALNNNQIVFL